MRRFYSDSGGPSVIKSFNIRFFRNRTPCTAGPFRGGIVMMPRFSTTEAPARPPAAKASYHISSTIYCALLLDAGLCLQVAVHTYDSPQSLWTSSNAIVLLLAHGLVCILVMDECNCGFHGAPLSSKPSLALGCKQSGWYKMICSTPVPRSNEILTAPAVILSGLAS